MNKVFLIGLAATAMMASCSSDDTVETSKQNAITFSNAFVDKSTRSNYNPSTTTASIDNFAVFGFTQKGQIFDGTPVTKTDGTWSYAPTQYWVAGNTYTFGAIAPASEAQHVSGEEVEGTKVKMNLAFTNINGEIDLLHAAPEQVSIAADTKNYDNTVQLTFNHQLSKVKFTFVNDVESGYNIKVSDIKINNAVEKAQLTINANEDNTWSGREGTLALNFGNAVSDNNTTNTDASPIAYTGEAESFYERLLIPTEAAQVYSIEFNVELLQGTVSLGTFKHTVVLENVPLQLGYSYDFKATLTAQNIVEPDNPLNPIKFNVESVKDWDNTEIDKTVIIPTTQTQAGN